MGLKDPAVDSLVEKVISAKSREELVVATKALDRVLWYQHILVPNWFMTAYRVSWWNIFGNPKDKPAQFTPMEFMIRYGWYDKAKDDALKAAMSAGKSL
jgi:microcin C transport system substrate-binding protein